MNSKTFVINCFILKNTFYNIVGISLTVLQYLIISAVKSLLLLFDGKVKINTNKLKVSIEFNAVEVPNSQVSMTNMSSVDRSLLLVTFTCIV